MHSFVSQTLHESTEAASLHEIWEMNWHIVTIYLLLESSKAYGDSPYWFIFGAWFQIADMLQKR